MLSFCCLFYDAERKICYITSTVGIFRKMINEKQFRKWVSWPNQGIFLSIPCGTEENHETFQDIFSFGDSNRVTFKYKYISIPGQKP
jgi:hypothetical protein